jgi:hypothetical protein
MNIFSSAVMFTVSMKKKSLTKLKLFRHAVTAFPVELPRTASVLTEMF